MIWAQTIQVAMLLTNSLTPLDDLIHHPSLSLQCIGQILQSVAIYTKWIAYTERAFATPSPLSKIDRISLTFSLVTS
jgi:hypothetical protein